MTTNRLTREDCDFWPMDRKGIEERRDRALALLDDLAAAERGCQTLRVELEDARQALDLAAADNARLTAERDTAPLVVVCSACGRPFSGERSTCLMCGGKAGAR